MPINFGLLGQQAAQNSPQQQQQPQGINFGLAQNIQQTPKVIANLPSQGGSSGDGGIGELLGGLKGLIGGFSGKKAGGGAGEDQSSNVAQPMNQPTQEAMESPQLAQNISGNSSQPTNQQPTQPLGPVSQDFMNSPAYKSSLMAYNNARSTGLTKSPMMTVVDFSLPATSKRLWVVNPESNQVMLNTYVTQGATPGFSNTPGSHQSSLGTYMTGATYQGQHGPSMRIQGLDKGINDKAASRDIVVHPASYAASGGKSWGCFGVPPKDALQFAQLTQGGSIMHAYAPGSQGSNPKDPNFITQPTMGNQLLNSPNYNPMNVRSPSNNLQQPTVIKTAANGFQYTSDKYSINPFGTPILKNHPTAGTGQQQQQQNPQQQDPYVGSSGYFDMNSEVNPLSPVAQPGLEFQGRDSQLPGTEGLQINPNIPGGQQQANQPGFGWPKNPQQSLYTGSQIAAVPKLSQLGSSMSSSQSPTNLSVKSIVEAAKAQYPDNPALAQLTASQAILESRLTGKPSGLASNHNNLFGVKGKGTAGSVSMPTKEFVNGKWIKINAPFAKNSSIQDSFQQHGKLLEKDRYKNVRNAATFEDASDQIYKAGYATDPTYTRQLREINNKYVLPEFNKSGAGMKTSLNNDRPLVPEDYKRPANNLPVPNVIPLPAPQRTASNPIQQHKDDINWELSQIFGNNQENA